MFTKANLTDLIAATGLVTLFGLCDLEIGSMALKNNRDFLPCPFQLCVSFHSYQCIQLGTNSPETLKSGRNWHFLSPMTTKLDWWHWKTIGHLSYASSSFMHHFIVISEFKFELQFRNTQVRSNLTIFCPRDIKISIMTLKNNRAPFLYPFKLYASSHSHWCVIS